MSDQDSVASDQAPVISVASSPLRSAQREGGEFRSAKPLPDESNREGIEEMLWHAVQWAQTENRGRWTEQVPAVEVMG